MKKGYMRVLAIVGALAVVLAALWFGPTVYGRMFGPLTPLGRLTRVAREERGFGVASSGSTRVWVLEFRSKTSVIITDQIRHLVPQERIKNGYLIPEDVWPEIPREAVDIIRENMSKVHLVESNGEEHSLISFTLGSTDSQGNTDTRQPELFFSLPKGVRPRLIRFHGQGADPSSVGIPFVMIGL